MGTYDLAKLNRLKDLATRAHISGLALAEDVYERDLKVKKRRARKADAESEAARHAKRLPKSETAAFDKEIAEAESEVKRLTVMRDHTSRQHQLAMGVRDTCQRYVDTHQLAARDDPGKPPSSGDLLGQGRADTATVKQKAASKEPMQQIGTLRQDLAKLKTQSQEVKDAPVPLAEAVERIDRHIARAAADYKSNFWRFVEGNYTELDVCLIDELDVTRLIEPMMMALFGDVFHDRAVKDVENYLADHPPGPATADRPARLAAIDAKIVKLEVEEERIICAAEEAGFEIERRADADPRFVLDVQNQNTKSPAPPAAKPGPVVDRRPPAVTRSSMMESGLRRGVDYD